MSSFRGKPIPKKLLMHLARHEYGTPVSDANGNYTWPSFRYIAYVRFEPSGKVILDRSIANDNTEIRLTLLMFYDEHNSNPKNISFNFGDRIIWQNKPYRIVSIDLLYDGAALHHQEIGLV